MGVIVIFLIGTALECARVAAADDTPLDAHGAERGRAEALSQLGAVNIHDGLDSQNGDAHFGLVLCIWSSPSPLLVS